MAVEDGLARQPWQSPSALLLAIAAISIGIAAFIAITAFDANVRDAVQHQAKSLLGADLVFSSRQPFAPETEALLAELGGEQSREISCTSMAYFPKSAASRLVQVRALEGDFPYYGALETAPALAAYTFRTGLQAVVDDGLLLQFDAQVGDTIKIGTLTLPIAGRLKKIPGEAVAAALIKPRVYMPLAALQQTALLDKGSIVTYKVYVRLPPGTDADALLETLHPHLTAYRLTGETARQRAARVGRLMTNLSRFLHLVGFVAVLLGGVGVASAIRVYITDKRDTVAILRCLGAPRTTGPGGVCAPGCRPWSHWCHDRWREWSRRTGLPSPPVARFSARRDATDHCLAGVAAGPRYWDGDGAAVCSLAPSLGAAGDALAGAARCLQRASTRRTRPLALGRDAPARRQYWRLGVHPYRALDIRCGLLRCARGGLWTAHGGGEAPHAAGQSFVPARVALRVASRTGESLSPAKPDPDAGVGPRIRDIFAHDPLLDAADTATSRRAYRCRWTAKPDFVRHPERSAP